MGAALAYYMALSLAPTVVIVLAIAGFVFGAEATQGRLVSQIQGLLGYEGAKVIQTMIQGARRPSGGIAAIRLVLSSRVRSRPTELLHHSPVAAQDRLTKEPEWEGVPAKVRGLLRSCLESGGSAILPMHGGCWGSAGRGSEVAALTFAHFQQRDGRWCIVDLVGKHGRVRTAPMPTWVEVAIDAWTAPAGVVGGCVFQPVNRADRVQGERLGEKVVWQMLQQYAAAVDVRQRSQRTVTLPFV